jgi:cellulose synthase/poly-beta-1,6-N-acetylglucosamine synthase-like glycosyltransferase
MLVSVLLLAAGVLLLVPTLILFFEIALGMFTSHAGKAASDFPNAKAVVLIPAHDEESGLAATLRNVMPQLGVNDRVLVVADNCSDQTAEIARSLGADAVERNNPARRSKGYALAHGIDLLAKSPPDVLIVLDADCFVSIGAIGAIKAQAIQSQRPVQIHTWMLAPEGHEDRFSIAIWSWRIRNELRPLALARLGLPCQLMGFGMGFPWVIAKDVQFASGNIVEDLELGLQLAATRKAAKFYTGASTYSTFPVSRKGEISQRRRWETGSFSMLLRHGWVTVFKGISSGNLDLTVLGLDMLVPPLVMHAGLLFVYAVAVTAGVFVFGASAVVLNLALASLVLFGASIALGWLSRGRDILPASGFLRLIPFVWAKFQIHAGGKKGSWVRTDRGKD